MNTNSNHRVLVFTAHPDDEILIAGTLHRLCLGGSEVTLVCATHGEKGAIRDGRIASRATVGTVRVAELEAAARTIGLANAIILDYPDGEVREEAKRLRLEVARITKDILPTMVITFGPDGVTGHEDHIAVSDAVTKAVSANDGEASVCHMGLPRALAKRLVVEFLLPSHERAEEGVTAARGLEVVDEDIREERISKIGSAQGELDFRVDVEDLLDIKAKVFRCHASQPGSERAGDDLFRELFRDEFFRAVTPPGVTPHAMRPFANDFPN